jgi:hypothetical protein
LEIISSLGTGQLSSYRKELAACGVPSTCLTLLTRYPYSIPEEEQPDTAIRWFQVAGWLQGELVMETLDPVSVFLIQQFLDYLEALNITFHKVRSGISAGLRTFTEQHGTSASFGKRQEYIAVAELLRHGHDVYMTLLDNFITGICDGLWLPTPARRSILPIGWMCLSRRNPIIRFALQMMPGSTGFLQI